ncbi:hypothetical protein IWW48_001841 [Coemansia sp. RSA 1200]|nr:hypothetical protein IWW48_001841 [Coemansia sp. RSA 1200]
MEALSAAAEEPTTLDSGSQKTEAVQTDSLTESVEKQQQTDLTIEPTDSSSSSDTPDNPDNKQESSELPVETPSTDPTSTDNDLKTSTTLVKPTSEPVSTGSSKHNSISWDSEISTPDPTQHQESQTTSKPAKQEPLPLKPSSAANIPAPTRHTVVNVATVTVDGKLVLSSETTIISDDNMNTIINSNGMTDYSPSNDFTNNLPFTSTVVVDGSTVIVTGAQGAEYSHALSMADLLSLKMKALTLVVPTVTILAFLVF